MSFHTRALFLLAGLCSISLIPFYAAQGAPLTDENVACLEGTWAAEGGGTKASTLSIQFDGRGRVWVSAAPNAGYVPADVKSPIVRDVEHDSASGKLFFSLPSSGRFYLQEVETDDVLIIRADNSSMLTGSSIRPQINDTKFVRTSATFKCIADSGSGAAASRPARESDDYSALQLLDGFGAVFIAVGEPVLFPIERAKTCKAESGSDLNASGCAVVGFVVSPFLTLRDALVGLGDIVTGGYFKLSRKSGVFRYFEKD